MNTYSPRRGGPLPLMRARSIEAQAAQRKRDDAWTAKMDRQLNNELKRRAEKSCLTGDNEMNNGNQASAEGGATLTEEQIDRFIPERIGVRNWGKPEQADLFNRGQVRDAIRTAIASQPNVQPKAAEVDAAPWSKTVESAALLLQRCTGLELQDCENLAGTILGMAALSHVQPKGTTAVAEVRATGANSCELFFLPVGVELKPGDKLYACPVQAPAPAPDHVPVSPEREAAIDAAVGIELLPPIRVPAVTAGLIKKFATLKGVIVQAIVRDVLVERFSAGGATQASAVGADDEQDAAKYRHWRDHAEVLCAVLRYESPAWIDAYLAEALAERDASQPPVQGANP